MQKLQVGDAAPAFSMANENGEILTLESFKGQKLVLYFYPKDNTPGCTTEACNFRDNFSELRKAGYQVLGVSMDTMRKHQNFIAKFELPFSLLADTNKEVIEAYGVWGEKKFMGRTFDGIKRTTFVIDEKGTIERIIEKVNNKQATHQILQG